jgi:hypothetical protein
MCVLLLLLCMCVAPIGARFWKGGKYSVVVCLPKRKGNKRRCKRANQTKAKHSISPLFWPSSSALLEPRDDNY